MESGLEDRNNYRRSCWGLRGSGLNGVRPRRPEQSRPKVRRRALPGVSMESGLEDRNNEYLLTEITTKRYVSQWSPA